MVFFKRKKIALERAIYTKPIKNNKKLVPVLFIMNIITKKPVFLISVALSIRFKKEPFRDQSIVF